MNGSMIILILVVKAQCLSLIVKNVKFLKKTNIVRMKTILFTITMQIKNISILLSPIIPLSSEKILNNMNLKKEEKNLDGINDIDIFNHELEFKKISILFKKIEDDN